MTNPVVAAIVEQSRDQGWVLEPQAKQVLAAFALDVPRHLWARTEEEAVAGAEALGYPVVLKIVSPQVVHKSDVDGVALGLADAAAVRVVYDRMVKLPGFAGVLVEETVKGLELFVGAKRDPQFGPILLLGLGGTAVEIYRDVAIRMAPLRPGDVEAMVGRLQGRRLLAGYRGRPPVSLEALKTLMQGFSAAVMALENDMDSIDLNPVMATETRCIVADARIMLRRG